MLCPLLVASRRISSRCLSTLRQDLSLSSSPWHLLVVFFGLVMFRCRCLVVHGSSGGHAHIPRGRGWIVLLYCHRCLCEFVHGCGGWHCRACVWLLLWRVVEYRVCQRALAVVLGQRGREEAVLYEAGVVLFFWLR